MTILNNNLQPTAFRISGVLSMSRSLFSFVVAMLISMPVSAAFFCVTNTAQLVSALDAAEDNNEDDIIALQSDTYLVADGLFFVPKTSDQNNDIEIIGGFFPGPFGPCQNGPQPDPLLTVLDGDQSSRILYLSPPEQGDVEIRNILFGSGNALNNPALGEGAGAMRLTQPVGSTFAGRLSVINNIFLDNTGSVAGALSIQLQGTPSTDIQVLNNMFLINDSLKQSGAAQITVSAPPPAPGPIINPRPAMTFAHNTVVNNQDDPEQGFSDIGGVRLSGDMPNVWVASNNFWGNQNIDLALVFGSDSVVRLLNNNIEDLFTQFPPGVDQGNISVEPTYVSCGLSCIDRVPTPDSALIDAGYEPPLLRPWALPATDLTGGPRQRGEQVDIGAYEGIPNILFRDRFED